MTSPVSTTSLVAVSSVVLDVVDGLEDGEQGVVVPLQLGPLVGVHGVLDGQRVQPELGRRYRRTPPRSARADRSRRSRRPPAPAASPRAGWSRGSARRGGRRGRPRSRRPRSRRTGHGWRRTCRTCCRRHWSCAGTDGPPHAGHGSSTWLAPHGEAVGGAWRSPEWGRRCGCTSAKRAAPRGRGDGVRYRQAENNRLENRVLFRRMRRRGPVSGEASDHEAGRRAEERLVLPGRLRSTAAPPPPAGPPWGMYVWSGLERDASACCPYRRPRLPAGSRPNDFSFPVLTQSMLPGWKKFSLWSRRGCHGARGTGRARRGDVPGDRAHRGAALPRPAGPGSPGPGSRPLRHPRHVGAADGGPGRGARGPREGPARGAGPLGARGARRHRQGAAATGGAGSVPAGRRRDRGPGRLTRPG